VRARICALEVANLASGRMANTAVALHESTAHPAEAVGVPLQFIHTARSTAYPQPMAGEGAGPGPLKVPLDQLRNMLGVSSVTVVKHAKSLALNDTTLA
jgi:hypothetical protein